MKGTNAVRENVSIRFQNRDKHAKLTFVPAGYIGEPKRIINTTIYWDELAVRTECIVGKVKLPSHRLHNEHP